jgi:hypothetical protein
MVLILTYILSYSRPFARTSICLFEVVSLHTLSAIRTLPMLGIWIQWNPYLFAKYGSGSSGILTFSLNTDPDPV